MDFFRQEENHQRFLCHPTLAFLCLSESLNIFNSRGAFKNRNDTTGRQELYAAE